jgi:hypothetical protein
MREEAALINFVVSAMRALFGAAGGRIQGKS